MNQTLKKTKVYITADDFGMSPGINWAIEKALSKGLITNASIIANGDCFDEAIRIAKKFPEVSFGLHFNLDYGSPIANLADVPLLISNRGFLKNGFIKYLLLSFKKEISNYKKQVELELRAQIERIHHQDIRLDYIDSHRHIHAIPFVNKIVKTVGKEYDILRVRSFNESFIKTLVQSKSLSVLHPAKLLKWFVFIGLSNINNDPKNKYFFSILLSSILNSKHAQYLSFDNVYEIIEIMVHVGNPEIDNDFYTMDPLTNRYIREKHRYTEMEFCNQLLNRLGPIVYGQ